MRIVVRSVLFCTDVAERPGAKGDHKERPFVDIVAGGREGMSLELFEITRDRIYNGQGLCGREDPSPECPKWTPTNKTHSLRVPNFLCPLPSYTRQPCGRYGDSPLGILGFPGASTSFSPSRPSTLRAVFRGECAVKP